MYLSLVLDIIQKLLASLFSNMAIMTLFEILLFLHAIRVLNSFIFQRDCKFAPGHTIDVLAGLCVRLVSKD